MSFKKRYATDESHETSGVWFDYGDGIMVRLARAGGSNKRYLKARTRLLKPYRRRNGDIPEDVMERIAKEALAEACVVDWQGVDLDEEGIDSQCTKENVLRAFELSNDFFEDCLRDATSMEPFLKEVEAKN